MQKNSEPPPASYRIRFWPLLLITTLSLVGLPILLGIMGPMGLLLLHGLLWTAGAFAVGRSRPVLLVSVSLAIVAMGLEWVLLRGEGRALLTAIALHLAAISFISVIGVYILAAVVRITTVTADTVLGGILSYLLLGVLFAFLYSLAEVISPGSFTLPQHMMDAGAAMTWIPLHDTSPLSPEAMHGKAHLLYFSFTTMTTLGYGDIAPRSIIVRSLSSIEAVLGQLYLAVFIARLVANALPFTLRAHSDATQ